jgi:hypothetical protein
LHIVLCDLLVDMTAEAIAAYKPLGGVWHSQIWSTVFSLHGTVGILKFFMIDREEVSLRLEGEGKAASACDPPGAFGWRLERRSSRPAMMIGGLQQCRYNRCIYSCGT